MPIKAPLSTLFLPFRRVRVFTIVCLALFLPLFLEWAARPGPLSAATYEDISKLYTIPYGGRFMPEDAKRMAWTGAWLKGVEEGAQKLTKISLLRVSEPDVLELQALAARLGMSRVTLRLQAPSENKGIDQHLSSEPMAVPALTVSDADPARLSQAWSQVETRARYAEVIVALSRLLPETLELADKAHQLRTGAARRELAFSAAPPVQRSPDVADSPVAQRLRELLDRLDAYYRYLKLLQHYNDRWDDPEAAAKELDAILALAPDAAPILASRAELLIFQARPAAALSLLEPIPHPDDRVNTPEWKRLPEALKEASPQEEKVAAARSDTTLFVRILRLRATACLSQGHTGLARSSLDQALQLAPTNADLYLTRGAVHQVAGETDAMCADYRQACSLGQCDGLASARKQNLCLPAN